MSAAFVQDEFLVLVLVNQQEIDVLQDAMLSYCEDHRVSNIVESKIAMRVCDRIMEAQEFGSSD